MHIITKRRLKEFATRHPDGLSSLKTWAKVTESQEWQSIQEARANWPSADAVGKLTVFNIGGNKYRLITYVDYTYKKVFMRDVLTHGELR